VPPSFLKDSAPFPKEGSFFRESFLMLFLHDFYVDNLVPLLRDIRLSSLLLLYAGKRFAYAEDGGSLAARAAGILFLFARSLNRAG